MSDINNILKKIRVERRDKILRRGESFNELYLFCPYCAYEQVEIWEGFDLQPNGKEREGQCQGCERYFMYSVDLSFSSRKMR